MLSFVGSCPAINEKQVPQDYIVTLEKSGVAFASVTKLCSFFVAVCVFDSMPLVALKEKEFRGNY